MTQGQKPEGWEPGDRGPAIQGDANQTDSFAACVRAAVAVLGGGEDEVDQIYAEGLSGAAFAPVCDGDEACAAWWMEGGNDLQIDLLGQVLGFAAEASPHLSGPGRRTAREAYERSGALSGDVAAFWKKARQAQQQGGVILQRTWPTWSLVAGWSDDLRQLPLRTMPGFEGLCKADPLFPTYVLRAAPASLSAGEAERPALIHGSRIATGEIDGDGYRYGAALYERAAARLEEGPFCAPCGGREWSCASRTLHRMRGSQMSAVGFLRRLGHFADLNGYLADALEHYEHMGRIVDRHLAAHRVRDNWDDPLYRYQLKESLRHLARLQVDAGASLSAAVAAPTPA